MVFNGNIDLDFKKDLKFGNNWNLDQRFSLKIGLYETYSSTYFQHAPG